jgi:hypothetical protein
MRITKKRCFIFIFIVFSVFFLCSAAVIPVPTPTPEIIIPVKKVEIIDTASIERSKKIKEKIVDIMINKNRENYENSINIQFKEKSIINNFLTSLDDLQNKTTSIRKYINISNENEKNDILNTYITIKNNIDELENVKFNFLNSIDPDDKILIKDQNESIVKSIFNLQNTLNSIDKEINELQTSKDLLNRTVYIEKEIKNISRQYRAIDWILFEQ